MSSNVDRLCANKNCNKVGKHLCSGCGEEIYCSKECQKSHWADHKQSCKTAVKPEAAALLKSLDSLSIKQLKNVMKAKAATFDNKKKQIVLTKLDSIVEKPNLVKFVQEHVEISEVEGLLSASPSSDSINASSSSSSSSKSNQAYKAAAAAAAKQPMPSPDQLRQQAKMMREQPNAVRKANAMFANMTDAQIRQYADQIEQAAADPQMMQEMARMAKMPAKDRNQLQLIQEGLSGAKPLDAAWIDSVVEALKTNPKIFKSMVQGKGAMLGGVTDEQTSSFIDTVSSMDAGILRFIIRGMIFLGSLYQPGLALYNTVDSYTLGCARYLVLFVVLIVLYYVSNVVFFFLRILFVNLYYLYTVVAGLVQGKAGAAAAGETVYQASSVALSPDLAAVAATAAATATGALKTAGAAVTGAAAVVGAAAATAASAGSGQTAAADAEDDKYDF